MLVDTQGLLMLAVVHPADTADRDSERLVLACMFGLYPYLQKLFADCGYQGPQFRKGLTKMLPRLSVDIVEHSHSSKSFEELAGRWVLKRSFAWLDQLSLACQGFREPAPQCFEFPAARVDPADAQKTMQPGLNFSDGL